ncbi:hypothetical protein CLOM_g2996 [Closterium sp. NIES-68]|nr:hypothetical protein CLOM_g2996 [Closterium sp. NIES-68]
MDSRTSEFLHAMARSPGDASAPGERPVAQEPLTLAEMENFLQHMLSYNHEDQEQEVWESLAATGVSISSVVESLRLTMESSQKPPVVRLTAAAVFLNLFLLPNCPVYSVFNPLAFSTMIQTLRQVIVGNPPSASNVGTDAPTNDSGRKKRNHRKGKGTDKQRKSSMRIDEDETGDFSDEDGNQRGGDETQSRLGVTLLSVLGNLSQALEVLKLANQSEARKALLGMLVEVARFSLDDQQWGEGGRGRVGADRTRVTVGGGRTVEAWRLPYHMLLKLMDPQHGKPLESAARVLMALGPYILMTHADVTVATSSSTSNGTQTPSLVFPSQLRSRGLDFVTSDILTRAPKETIPAVESLMRYLCLHAPERAEGRAAAVEAVVKVYGAVGRKERERFFLFVGKLARVDRAAARVVAVDLSAALGDAQTGRENGNGRGVGNGRAVLIARVGSCLELMYRRASDVSPTVRARALVALTASLRTLKGRPSLLDSVLADHARASNLAGAADPGATPGGGPGLRGQPVPGAGVGVGCSGLGVEEVLGMVRRRLEDEKGLVRKAAVGALEEIVGLSSLPLREELVDAIGELCSDSLLSVRRVALTALSKLTVSNPGHVWLRAKWLQSALVLILDNEACVQDQALDLLASLLLQPLGQISTSSRPSASTRVGLCKDRPLHVCVKGRGVPPAPVLCEGEGVCEACEGPARGEGVGAVGGGNAAAAGGGGGSGAAAAAAADGSVRSTLAWLMAVGQRSSSVAPLLHRACAVLARRNGLNTRLVEGLQAVIEAAEGWQIVQQQQQQPEQGGSPIYQQQQQQQQQQRNTREQEAGSSLWRWVVRGAWLLLQEVTSFSPQGVRWEFLISRWRDGRTQQEAGNSSIAGDAAMPGSSVDDTATPSRAADGTASPERDSRELGGQEREAQVHVLKALCNIAARIPGEKAIDVAAGLLHNLRSFQLSPEEAGVHMVALATLNRRAAAGSGNTTNSGRNSSNRSNSNSNSNHRSNSSIPAPGGGRAAEAGSSISQSPEAAIATWCLELCTQATAIVRSHLIAGGSQLGSPGQRRERLREAQQEEKDGGEEQEQEQGPLQKELREGADGQAEAQRLECAVFVCGQLALIAGELAETQAAGATATAGSTAAAAAAAAAACAATVAGDDSDSDGDGTAAANGGRQGRTGKGKGSSGGRSSRGGKSSRSEVSEQLAALQSALKEASQCVLELLLGASAAPAPIPAPTAAAANAGIAATAGTAAAAAAAAAGMQVLQAPVLAHGWLAQGRFCLVDHALAKTCVPLFVQELQCSPLPSVRNNIVIVLTDLCVRYTALVDPHVPCLSACLRDPCELVRRQALVLLAGLLQRDYVKWRGTLVLRMLLSLVDASQAIREVALHLFTHVVPRRVPLVPYNIFIEALFALNACPFAPSSTTTAPPLPSSGPRPPIPSLPNPASSSNPASSQPAPSNPSQPNRANSTSPGGSTPEEEGWSGRRGRRTGVGVRGAGAERGGLEEELERFSLSGPTRHAARTTVYRTLLRLMVREHHLALSAKLCLQVLAPVLDGALPLSCPSVQAVVGDALDILSCKEMRPGSGKAAAAGGGGAAANAVKGRVVTQLMKKNLVENTIPILIELKRLLEAQNSPLQGALMGCLRCLFKEYRAEIEDLLAADPQLAKELVYDIQKHEAARARAVAAASRACAGGAAGGSGGGGGGGSGAAAAAASDVDAAAAPLVAEAAGTVDTESGDAAEAADAADAAAVGREEGDGEEESREQEAGARSRRKSAEFRTPTKDRAAAAESVDAAQVAGAACGDGAAAVGTPPAAAVASAGAPASSAGAAASHSNVLSASNLCSPLFVTPNPPSRTRSRSRSRLGNERFGRSGLASTEEDGQGQDEEDQGEEQSEEERAQAAVQAAARAAAIIRDIEEHGNKTPVLRTVSVPRMETRVREAEEEGEGEAAGLHGKEAEGTTGQGTRKGGVLQEIDCQAAVEKGRVQKGGREEVAARTHTVGSANSGHSAEGGCAGAGGGRNRGQKSREKGNRGVPQGEEEQVREVGARTGGDLPARHVTRRSAKAQR